MEEYVRECKMRDRSVHLEDWRTLHICRKLTSLLATLIRLLMSQRLTAPVVWCTVIVSTTSVSPPAPPSDRRPPVLLSTTESASRAASVRQDWSELGPSVSRHTSAEIVRVLLKTFSEVSVLSFKVSAAPGEAGGSKVLMATN